MLTKLCSTTRKYPADKKHLLLMWCGCWKCPFPRMQGVKCSSRPVSSNLLLTAESFARTPESQAYLMRSRRVINSSNFWSLREKGVAREGAVAPLPLTSHNLSYRCCSTRSCVGVPRNMHGNGGGFSSVKKNLLLPQELHVTPLRYLDVQLPPKYLFRCGLCS